MPFVPWISIPSHGPLAGGIELSVGVASGAPDDESETEGETTSAALPGTEELDRVKAGAQTAKAACDEARHGRTDGRKGLHERTSRSGAAR